MTASNLSTSESEKNQGAALRVFLFAVGISNFDRFTITPMLVVLATGFGAPLSDVAAVASIYFMTYGFGQLIWGVISDRFGRIAVVRIALAGAALGCFLSAMASSVFFLLVMRAMTGAFCGAIVPATITYIGDTVDVRGRQKSLADMLAMMAIGSVLATGLAGAIAEYASWRIVFLLTACLASLAFIRFRGIKNVHENNPNKSSLAMLAPVFQSPWALGVMAFALIEGAVVLGLFVLLPAAMEQRGLGSSAAGIVAALYGVSVLIVSRAVKYLARKLLLPMSIGGFCLILSFMLPACYGGVSALACTAILLGATWALFHSSLQTWMTMVVPQARATAVAAMTTALFLGSGLGTSLAEPLVEAHNLTLLFKLAASVSTLLVVTAIFARNLYTVYAASLENPSS